MNCRNHCDFVIQDLAAENAELREQVVVYRAMAQEATSLMADVTRERDRLRQWQRDRLQRERRDRRLIEQDDAHEQIDIRISDSLSAAH